MGPGRLDRIFHSFRAGDEQCAFFGKITGNQGVQLFANGNVTLIAQHHEAGMGEGFHLIQYGLLYLGVQVSRIQHCDTAGKIDVFTPFHIPNRGVFSTICENRVDGTDTSCHGIVPAGHQGLVGLVTGSLPGNRLVGGWLELLYVARHDLPR